MTEKEDMQDIILKPSNKKIKWLFFILAFIIFLILISYGLLAYAAQSMTLPFIKYQGQDVGLKTFSQVTKIVLVSDKQIKTSEVSLNYDGKTEKKKLDDLGISIQSSKTVDNIFNFGKKNIGISFPNFSYFKSLAKKNTEVSLILKYSSNTEKKIGELFPESEKDPVDPSLSLSEGNLLIQEGSDGTKADLNDLIRKIQNQLNGKLSGNLQIQKINTKSNFNTKDLETFKSDIEGLISKQLYLQSDYKKIQVKKEHLLSFVDLEMTVLNQKLTLSDQKISDYLNSTVAKSFNVKGAKREISTVDNQVISEGREGKQIDINQSQANIKKALENNEKIALIVVTSTPIQEEYVSPDYNLGKYPGKYIEVNLSEQMLYTIEGNALVNSYRVSTGKWSMPTPEGEYSINDKNARAYSSKYDLYMPYWMSFIGSEYGIHELPEWADGTKEGEAHLGTPVSHGCIRLGRGSAQSVYDWAEVGTPVYIHR
jgi:hypothetical protein